MAEAEAETPSAEAGSVANGPAPCVAELAPAPPGGVPWDGRMGAGEEEAGAEDGTAVPASSEGDLIDRLRLETDLELELGVDIKADLGLEDVSLGNEFSADAGTEPEVGGGVAGVAVGSAPAIYDGGADAAAFEEDLAGPGGRPDDLGFEIIHKDEVSGASPRDGELPSSDSRGGRNSRRGWPWSWSRS